MQKKYVCIMEVSTINNNYQYKSCNPSFGVYYNPKTVKLLKKITPEFLRYVKNEQDYNLVKSSIKHLINAGKRIDDYCVELNNDYLGGCVLSIRAKKLTGKCKDFFYPPYMYGRTINDTIITDFYKQCKFIDSDEFAPQTEKAIDKYINHRKSQTKWKNFKDDASWFWYNLSEKFEDGFDDLFAVVIDVNNGWKKSWYPVTAIKDFFHNKKIYSEIDSENFDKIKEIKELIDKMRTKPIKIEVQTTKINDASKIKLIEKK